MIRSLNSGVSGLQQFQTRLDVIGNNIANSNTIGFKAGRAEFGDTFSQTLQTSSGGSGTLGSTPGQQIGAGVTTTAIRNNFGAGPIDTSGGDTDFAIAGEGFFMVRDPISGDEFATRAGDFHIDNSGYLVTNQGFRVQGFNDVGLANRGDLKIDAAERPATADPDAGMAGYKINSQGLIQVSLEGSTGTFYSRGQILLQNFRDPQALMKVGNNLYSSITAAGPLGGAAAPESEAPGTNGLGKLETNSRELSNVDLTTEFANLITTQRAFQASARIITTSDEVLQEMINLKR